MRHMSLDEFVAPGVWRCCSGSSTHIDHFALQDAHPQLWARSKKGGLITDPVFDGRHSASGKSTRNVQLENNSKR